MNWSDEYKTIKNGDVNIWKKFIEEHIDNLSYKARREHLLRVWDDLLETDFVTAPASTHYHHAYEGGLLKHSCETIALSLSFKDICSANISDESLFTCSFLHDYGKVGKYRKNPKFVISPEEYPYIYIKRHADLTDPMRSVIYASQMIPDIGEDELFAILYHDGLYPDENLRSKNKETPLLLMIHWADMWSARMDQHGW